MSTPAAELPPLGTDDLVPRVARYVNSSEANTYVQDVTAEALAMVTKHVGGSPVPRAIMVRAVVEVAADLYWRQQARGGIQAFDGGESGPELRPVANDPLRSIRPILRPYLMGGFA